MSLHGRKGGFGVVVNHTVFLSAITRTIQPTPDAATSCVCGKD